jgi:hypothetical protein
MDMTPSTSFGTKGTVAVKEVAPSSLLGVEPYFGVRIFLSIGVNGERARRHHLAVVMPAGRVTVALDTRSNMKVGSDFLPGGRDINSGDLDAELRAVGVLLDDRDLSVSRIVGPGTRADITQSARVLLCFCRSAVRSLHRAEN